MRPLAFAFKNAKIDLDEIGGYLTEINVTSPTGIQEANTLDGVRLEARVLDGVERLLAGKDA